MKKEWFKITIILCLFILIWSIYCLSQRNRYQFIDRTNNGMIQIFDTAKGIYYEGNSEYINDNDSESYLRFSRWQKFIPGKKNETIWEMSPNPVTK